MILRRAGLSKNNLLSLSLVVAGRLLCSAPASTFTPIPAQLPAVPALSFGSYHAISLEGHSPPIASSCWSPFRAVLHVLAALRRPIFRALPLFLGCHLALFSSAVDDRRIAVRDGKQGHKEEKNLPTHILSVLVSCRSESSNNSYKSSY